MAVIIRDRHYSFAVFSRRDVYFLTVLAKGSLDHDITMRLTEHEVQTFKDDRNKAIATASDLVGRTAAYRDRLVDPPITPS